MSTPVSLPANTHSATFPLLMRTDLSASLVTPMVRAVVLVVLAATVGEDVGAAVGEVSFAVTGVDAVVGRVALLDA